MLVWLETNIEPANKHDKEQNPMPYYVSTAGQFALYVGETSLWHLEVRGIQLKTTVDIVDTKMATKFALECAYAQ